MEITPIDGEDVVLEETLETDVDHSDPSADADSEVVEQPEEVQDGTGEGEKHEGGEDAEEGEETKSGTLESTEQGEGDSDEPLAVDEPYTLENPMPVMIVEPETEEYEMEVFSLSGSYPGTISDTYLNYFRGIVQKLDWKQHYVVYRSGQYSYTMVYGEDVTLNGSRFTGSGNVVNLYRNTSSSSSDWYVSYSTDSLSLSAGSLYVYSDLGMYPTLKEGGSSLEFAALLFAVGFAVVYSVCHDIFDYVMEHVYRK